MVNGSSLMMTYPFTGGVVLSGAFNILSTLTHLTHFSTSLISLSGEQHDWQWESRETTRMRLKGPGVYGEMTVCPPRTLMIEMKCPQE